MIPALIGGAIQLGTAIYGYLKANGRRKEADELLAKAGGSFDNISLPDLEQLSAETLGPTEFAKIKADPALRQAQMDTLGKMKGLEDGGGFNNEDRANLSRMYNEAARRESGQRQLISDQMAARGQGGGGAELAMQLAAGQGAADRNMQAGLDTAGMAQKRYFDAIRARNQMAGGMRGQDFGEQAQAAQAQDAINRFNLGHRYDVQRYNNDLSQQQYGNNMDMARTRYGVAKDRANVKNGQAAQSEQFWDRIGSGVAGGVRAIGNAGSAATQPAASVQANAGGSQYGAGVEYDPNNDAYSVYDGKP